MADTAKELMGECPENIEQAILRATELCLNGGVDTDFWDETEESFTAQLHHTLGQHMRNYWGLWSQDTPLWREMSSLFMLSHADDMSGLIITGVYRHNNDLDLNLEKEAVRYHRFWIETLERASRDGPFTMPTKEQDDDIPY